MRVRLAGEWGRAQRILQGSVRKLRGGMEAAVREEAKRARDEVVRGVRKQAPGGKALEKPSPLTLASRQLEGLRGRNALQASGELLRALTSVARGLEAFVGIRSNARGKDGRPLADIAQAQEEGVGPIAIPMTEGMRRYLGVLRSRANGASGGEGGGGGSGVIVVRIPARPFLRPAFEAAMQGARQRLRDRIARRFGLR